MMTNAASTSTGTARREALDAATATQKVVIVNGSTDILGLLQTVLDAGHYDVVFVESNERAYSQIKRVQPNLVILCVRIDDMDGCQVLSMLNLDQETRDIPILTYTTEYAGQDADEELAEPSEGAMFSAGPAIVRMN
ncbi:MAG: response regulator [Acidobacteria bacterium]|nr:response regulator [Acidobacteriota bacterium]